MRQSYIKPAIEINAAIQIMLAITPGGFKMRSLTPSSRSSSLTFLNNLTR